MIPAVALFVISTNASCASTDPSLDAGTFFVISKLSFSTSTFLPFISFARVLRVFVSSFVSVLRSMFATGNSSLFALDFFSKVFFVREFPFSFFARNSFAGTFFRSAWCISFPVSSSTSFPSGATVMYVTFALSHTFFAISFVKS